MVYLNITIWYWTPFGVHTITNRKQMKNLSSKSILIKSILSVLVIATVFVACSQKAFTQTQSKNKSTFVLVHGAFLGAWSWEKVKDKLENLGHKVVSVDLPSHGNDKTNIKDITMKSYTDAVSKVINLEDGKVILVGHSFGGVTISQVAEYMPRKVKGLVYVSALLLPNNQSLLDATKDGPKSLAFQHLVFSKDHSYVSVEDEFLHEGFAKDLSYSDFLIQKEKFVVEPTKPFSYKLQVSEENWVSIDRFYIETLKDNAVLPSFQKSMYTNATVNKVYSLNSDHLPMFSKVDELTSYLDDVSKQLNQ